MSRFALFFAALSFLYASALHSQGRPPAPVIVAEVLEKKIHSDITLVGTVQPRRSSLVASETDGKVVTRFKDGGQQVRVNDPIFRLNNDQLEASLIEARADVELQKSNHTRNLELLKTEAVSEQDLRDSEYQLARARAKLQNLELEEGGRDDHYVILKRIATKHSEGELVAMFFTDKGGRTDLEIVSKRRFALNFFAKNWTASLFRAIDMELGIPPQE